MGADWTALPLREVGVQLIDCVHRTPPAATSGYPYIAIPQLNEGRLDLSDVRLISDHHYLEWTQKAKAQEWDVILSRRCNPGETAVVPKDLKCALGQNLVLLRADGTAVAPEYLRWLARSPAWWTEVHRFINVGAVFDSLRCQDIPEFVLPIPPLDEQRAIASVLGAIDEKIELNRRMNETIMAFARTIASLATRDKAERRLADVAVWERAIVNPGETPDLRFEHLSLPAFDDGQVPVRETGKLIKSHKLRVPRDSVLIAKLNPHIPRVWRPDDIVLLNPVASTEWVVLRPIEDGAADLLHALVSSEDFMTHLATLATGTTGSHQRVNPHDVLNMTLRWPEDSAEVKTYVRLLYELSRSNNRESQTLVCLRDLLLPWLISGRLRIKVAPEVNEAVG